MNEKAKRMFKALPWILLSIFVYWGMFYIATMDYPTKQRTDTGKEVKGG